MQSRTSRGLSRVRVATRTRRDIGKKAGARTALTCSMGGIVFELSVIYELWAAHLSLHSLFMK